MHASARDTDVEIRHAALDRAFRGAFGGARPTHLVRAPGRVNLIGEHTDYCGLPVFPMAIQRDVAILLRAREDGRVRLVNVESAHGPREFELAVEIPTFPQGDWGNYAKAAAQALVARSGIQRGMDAVVAGDVPPAAGLSSSSALVVANALALLAASGVDVDEPRPGDIREPDPGGTGERRPGETGEHRSGEAGEYGPGALGRAELMELLPKAERYVGTHSGGMDQAICLGGRKGRAVVIDFAPLRLRPTPVPSDWRFVIANTLVEARKSGSAREAYNTRTVDCREALRLLLEHPRGRSLPSTYLDLVRHVPQGALLDLSEVLPEPLRRRFRHVVGEGARVEDARAAMLEGDLEAFGRLMDASHESLRSDYDVSCPELDEIVGIAREHGAAGARLTGAGFGGCAVALTRAAHVEPLLAGLRDGYYRPRGVDPRAADALLVAEPSDGARVTAL